MDNMEAGWTRPMEDEFALQNLGIPSPYLAMMFPNHGQAYVDYLTLRDLNCRRRQQWKAALLRFCQRLSRIDDRRLVLKSPTHTARIRTILEVFPEAQFIHVSREPNAMFRSTVDLWRTLSSEMGLQVMRDDQWIERYVLETLPLMYGAYLEDRELLPPGQLAEVRYEDLARDPVTVIRGIYGALAIGNIDAVEAATKEYLLHLGNYQTNVHCAVDTWNEVIADQWATYSRTFGYDQSNSRRKLAA